MYLAPILDVFFRALIMTILFSNTGVGAAPAEPR
jgi:hypothetical protein